MSNSRYNWPSELSCAIAEAILEDTTFVKSYTARSRERLAEQYIFATNILEQSGIEYFRGGYVSSHLYCSSLPNLC